jgi:hypothetical protein
MEGFSALELFGRAGKGLVRLLGKPVGGTRAFERSRPMKSHRYLSYFGVAMLIVAFSAGSVFGQMHLDLSDPTTGKNGLPGDCSIWHELYPVFCLDHHQIGYEDNGDSVISACDYIYLADATGGSMRYHIEAVVPTYYLSSTIPGTDQFILEGEGPPGTNAYCETWHEVYPVYCQAWHVEEWIDNGDGIVSECDYVYINGQQWHIDRIGVDIIIDTGSPAGGEAWGTIKSLFGQVF